MSETNDTIVGSGSITFQLGYRDLMSDQGVGIHVLGEVDGERVEVLRFDCFDHGPHYHYGPEKKDERLMLDRTTEGDSLEWALDQLETRLPQMVERAGYEELARQIDMEALASTLAELRSAAQHMAREERSTVKHDRGDVIVDAGPVRFGVEFRELTSDRGVAIHVLGDVGDEEVEMLTFDCFENGPHYHYGPQAKNQRLYLDTTAAPDAVAWALDLFKGGKLGPMLERAGYADHAARLNPATVARKVAELGTVATEMQSANARGA
jgi:hypothetical protein